VHFHHDTASEWIEEGAAAALPTEPSEEGQSEEGQSEKGQSEEG
jgi:hypothetical protein